MDPLFKIKFIFNFNIFFALALPIGVYVLNFGLIFLYYFEDDMPILKFENINVILYFPIEDFKEPIYVANTLIFKINFTFNYTI